MIAKRECCGINLIDNLFGCFYCKKCFFVYNHREELIGIRINFSDYDIEMIRFFNSCRMYNSGIYITNSPFDTAKKLIDYKFTTEEDLRNTLIKIKESIEFL